MQNKKWYELEQKTREDEVIVFKGFGNFVISGKNPYSNDFWVEEEPRMYFKQDSQKTDSSIEVFISYFYNMLGLQTVKAVPAILIEKDKKGISERKQGVLTEDFKDNNKQQKEVSLYNLVKSPGLASVSDAMIGLKIYKDQLLKEGNKRVIVQRGIEDTLSMLTIADFATAQFDRNQENISFLKTVKDGVCKIELAKIFDNSMAFFSCLTSNKKRMMGLFEQERFEELNKEIDKSYSSKFFMYSSKKIKNNIYLEKDNTKVMAKQIARKMHKNPKIKNFFQKLQGFDLDDVLTQIKKDIPNYKISKKDYVLYKYIFNYRILKIEKEYDNVLLKNANKTSEFSSKEFASSEL